ncbi:MAG: NAD-dependent epimerase/dehydratase family protein [Pseudomonadota bacterium]
MRVFILGGTGSIGTALLEELRAWSHSVVALSRSEASDRKIRQAGAQPFRGDLREPDSWVDEALGHEAVIQAAATFGDDMGDVDGNAVAALIEGSARLTEKCRMLYTGGCWLYGETGDIIATEDLPFNPLPAFGWMVEHGQKLLACPALSTAVIHPAMVYHDEGGVFERFLSAARQHSPIEIWGGADTRWPIVERSDLARAYCELLTRPDLTGHFNAVSQEGVRVGDIAAGFAGVYGNTHEMRILAVEDLVRKHGAWAKGPTLDQQMSAGKLRSATGWQPLVTDYRTSGVFSR